MKGIILAGGKGTRLWPLTQATNKHLVSVGNLPMIEYPLFTLKNLGVDSISVVTGGEHFKDIAGYLGSVHRNINFSYHYQREPKGIAHALAIPKRFLDSEKIAVILGDNIFEDNFYKAAKEFENSGSGAMLFLKKVNDPWRFGVAEINENGRRIISIEEKPKKPKSNLIVTGLYFYDSSIFNKIKKLKPSSRGELEITEVNNMYIKERKASYFIVDKFWSDAGVVESRQKCEKFVSKDLEKKVISAFPKETKELLPSGLKNN